MMAKGNSRRSQVTVELPDELIDELLEIGKLRNVSVRQQIREVFAQISRMTAKPSPIGSINDRGQSSGGMNHSAESFHSRTEY